MEEKLSIGIIGIGNLLLSDEGFGIHLIRYLEENYEFPDNVSLMDAGTAGIYMAPFLEESDIVYIVDVVNIEAEPGVIRCYNGRELKAALIHTSISPHQLGLLEIIDICRLREKAPKEIEFICVTPKTLKTGIDLSALLQRRIQEVARMIIVRLSEHGAEVIKMSSNTA